MYVYNMYNVYIHYICMILYIYIYIYIYITDVREIIFVQNQKHVGIF